MFDFDHEIELIDPQQMAVLAAMLPEDRVLNSMATSEWVLAGLRGALHERHPEWSQRRLNLEALAWMTPLRGAGIREFIERELQ